MWDFILLHVSAVYALVFCLIWLCDEGNNRRIWIILALHSAFNALFNIYAYPHLEWEPLTLVASLTTGDALVILFLLRIWGNLAKAQILLVSIAWGYQWVALLDLNDYLFPQSDPLLYIYEPLILAIGVSQLLLGGNAIASGFRKFACSIRIGGRLARTAIRSGSACEAIQIRVKK